MAGICFGCSGQRKTAHPTLYADHPGRRCNQNRRKVLQLSSNTEDGDFYGQNAALLATNGAQVDFTADAQTLNGDITVDTISQLNMTLQNGSVFTGTVNIVNNEQGGAAVSDNAVVTVESGCTWNLTGNCTLTSLTNNGAINFNGYTITLADGTVLK